GTHLQGNPFWEVAAARRHRVAAAPKRETRSERRCIQRGGWAPSDGGTVTGITRRAQPNAVERTSRWTRWPEPHTAITLPRANRTEPTEQHAFHLRPERLAAWVDPTPSQLRHRLHRLGAAGVWHCRRAFWRSEDDGGIPFR